MLDELGEVSTASFSSSIAGFSYIFSQFVSGKELSCIHLKKSNVSHTKLQRSLDAVVLVDAFTHSLFTLTSSEVTKTKRRT